MDSSPLTRAAADGDATEVRTLLAEGKDVNVKTPKGQTPLILAAFFGHAGVVRVLLEAGADVGMKDSLGLTAMEWSARRGFSDVIQVFHNAPPADLASRRKNGNGHSRTEAEEVRRSVAEETRKEAEQKARERTAEEARIRAAQELKQEVDARLEAEASTPRELPAWGPPELAKREVEAEAQRAANELRAQAEEEARKKVEAENRRLAEAENCRLAEEQNRRLAEKQNRRLAEEESRRLAEAENDRVAEAEKPSQTISQALTLGSAANEFRWDSDIKRCPKCYRVYTSDLLAYCSYDSTRLLSEDDPTFRAAVKPDASPSSTLWVLVMITLLGSGSLGYLVGNYISGWQSTDAPIAERPERANVEQDQPVIGGTLKGKETTLPNAEYPAIARSQGIAGKVTVAVLVNRQGMVVSARALSGDRLLLLSAVEAARKAQFSPEKLTDQRSRIPGTITYSFK